MALFIMTERSLLAPLPKVAMGGRDGLRILTYTAFTHETMQYALLLCCDLDWFADRS